MMVLNPSDAGDAKRVSVPKPPQLFRREFAISQDVDQPDQGEPTPMASTGPDVDDRWLTEESQTDGDATTMDDLWSDDEPSPSADVTAPTAEADTVDEYPAWIEEGGAVDDGPSTLDDTPADVGPEWQDEAFEPVVLEREEPSDTEVNSAGAPTIAYASLSDRDDATERDRASRSRQDAPPPPPPSQGNGRGGSAGGDLLRGCLTSVVSALLGVLLTLGVLYALNGGLMYETAGTLPPLRTQLSNVEREGSTMRTELDSLRLNTEGQVEALADLEQALDATRQELETLDDELTVNRELLEQVTQDVDDFDDVMVGLRDLLLDARPLPTATPTLTPSPTSTPTITPSPSATSTARATPTVNRTETPGADGTETPEADGTGTPGTNGTETPEADTTSTPRRTATPRATASPNATATP